MKKIIGYYTTVFKRNQWVWGEKQDKGTLVYFAQKRPAFLLFPWRRGGKQQFSQKKLEKISCFFVILHVHAFDVGEKQDKGTLMYFAQMTSGFFRYSPAEGGE